MLELATKDKGRDCEIPVIVKGPMRWWTIFLKIYLGFKVLGYMILVGRENKRKETCLS